MCGEWVQQDSNLQPAGYASHYGFHRPMRAHQFVGWTFPSSFGAARREDACQQVSTPSQRRFGLGSGLPFRAEVGFPEFDR